MPYELIIIPIIVVILAQILKLATDGIKYNLNLINIFGKYGGMPSGHTAFVSSIGILIFLKEGIDSTYFAIWLIFMIVVARDALGARQEISRHSKVIKKIAEKIDINIPILNTRVGHKPKEVIGGMLFGTIITLVIKFFVG
ncbi:divergent PAP2 family protein [Candidatus Parcubacteria bacterium]|nr:divergent PAP2 family protein [Candidatus Parcubacteria bacterium]